jgi:L-2-hydroxyglutarate oxidase
MQVISNEGHLIEDFMFQRGANSLCVLNAPSPAATSSLAMARVITDEAEAAGMRLT